MGRHSSPARKVKLLQASPTTRVRSSRRSTTTVPGVWPGHPNTSRCTPPRSKHAPSERGRKRAGSAAGTMGGSSSRRGCAPRRMARRYSAGAWAWNTGMSRRSIHTSSNSPAPMAWSMWPWVSSTVRGRPVRSAATWRRLPNPQPLSMRAARSSPFIR